jgi:hypothetical protein
MRVNRIGAICAFVLTFQFLATLAWIVVSLPADGLGGLDQLVDAMAAFFTAYATRPVPFAILNLYNASFAITAVVLVIILRERLAQARLKMQLAVIAISVAAALFLASGIIPIVSGPTLVKLNDASALRATIGVVAGLVLAATTAAGFGVTLTAWSGFETGRLPVAMCWLMIIGGLMEIAEFTVPIFLILDPALGTVWSLWLGFFLWRTDS